VDDDAAETLLDGELPQAAVLRARPAKAARTRERFTTGDPLTLLPVLAGYR
jgi:hypothetical protein